MAVFVKGILDTTSDCIHWWQAASPCLPATPRSYHFLIISIAKLSSLAPRSRFTLGDNAFITYEKVAVWSPTVQCIIVLPPIPPHPLHSTLSELMISSTPRPFLPNPFHGIMGCQRNRGHKRHTRNCRYVPPFVYVVLRPSKMSYDVGYGSKNKFTVSFETMFPLIKLSSARPRARLFEMQFALIIL